MIEMVDLVLLVDVMVGLYLKIVRPNLKLPKGDPKSMHAMFECWGQGARIKAIPWFQKVLHVDCHLGNFPTWRINPCNLNKMSDDVIFDNFIQ